MDVKSSLQRKAWLINHIKRHPNITFKKLQEDAELQNDFGPVVNSRSTIQRHIKEIRYDFRIAIRYDRRAKGYYIDEENSEFDRLLEAFQLFNFYSIWDKLPDCVLPEKHTYSGAEHLQPLLNAIKKIQRVAFDYRKYSPEIEKERVLEPYVLKECKGRWYVIGREKDGNFKTFGLDRMKNIRVLPDKFAKNPGFDITRKFEHSFGIVSFEDCPVEKIVLAFDARDGHYLKSVPLHHSQEIIKDTPNEFIIQLRLRITFDFIMEIMSRSRSLRVIAPKSLRLEIRAIYEKALERNK